MELCRVGDAGLARALIDGHPLLRLASLGDRPGFALRACPDLPAAPARPLRVGAASLAAFGLADPIQPGSVPRYDSVLFTLEEPTVVSDTGIVVLRTGEAVEDTLDHTAPDRDGYRREAGGTVMGDDGVPRNEGGRLFVPAPRRRLPGRYLSLLLGNVHNHYHWLVMNLARAALLTEQDIASLDGVLVPAKLTRTQRDWLALTGLRRYVAVDAAASVTVERLLMPWNVASSGGASVRAMRYLRGWTGEGGAATRVVIDRRKAPMRPLANETELIDALTARGFVAAELERMSAAEQVALFRGADTIVGCHGAGLANIAFAAPGTRIVELMPSTTINWAYRHMAAACGHRYDCVVGRSDGQSGSWRVAATHVLSALDA